MRRPLSSLLLSLCLSAFLILPWGVLPLSSLDDIRNLIFDIYQRHSPRAYNPESPVRVVGVDEVSLATYGQWPWSRQQLAEIINRLRNLGAAAIVIDFIFAEPDRGNTKVFIHNLPTPQLRRQISNLLQHVTDSDDHFVNAIAATPSVLSAALSQTGSASIEVKAGLVTAGDNPSPFLMHFPAIISSIPSFTAAAHGVGATNWILDHDRIVRRIPLLAQLNNIIIPAISLEALRVAQGADTIIIRSSNASGEEAFGSRTGVNTVKVGDIEINTGPSAVIRPRYRYYDSTQDISVKDLLEGRVASDQIKGFIVFLGATAVGIGDIVATPLQPNVPGVALQAQATEAMLEGASLSRPDWALGLELWSTLLLVIFITFIVAWTSPIISLAVSTILIFALFYSAYNAFVFQGLLFDAAYPSLSIICTYFLGSIIQWRNSINTRRDIRNAFGKFVAPAVVAQLTEHPELLKLGGETKELSVMFSDLRNFTKISEGMNAQELTCFMNDYLTPMTDIILDFEGTIDKYIGDAILAFWNAPLDIHDHGRKSVQAALQMRAALDQFNRDQLSKIGSDGNARRVRFAIGLNLGPCCVGNMGSTRRFDYSILGDSVNFASRLEGCGKHFNTDIIASSSISACAPEMGWLDLGLVIVAGKSQPQRLYALAGNAEFARSHKFQKWEQEHSKMIRMFESYQYHQAGIIAQDLSHMIGDDWLNFYQTFSDKFKGFENEPAKASAPIWRLTSK